MKVIDVFIKDLNPSTYNPRKISIKQFEDLKKSIERFGFVDPIVVNNHPERKNIVIGGHQRLKVAESLKMEKIPVVFVTLAESQERELNIRLNKNNGEWDWDILANEFDLDDLINNGFMREEFGIKEKKEISDKDIKLFEIYEISVKCDDQIDMEDKYKKIKSLGIECKLITL